MNDSRHMASSPIHRRVGVVGSIMVLAIMAGLVALIGRVVQLQVRPASRIAARIDSQHSRVSLTARRGVIFDRHGRVLAASRMAKLLFVDPQLIEDPNTFSENLAYRLGDDPAMIEQKVSRRWDRRWAPIDRYLNQERIEKLKGSSWRAVGVQDWSTRDYPNGHRAGQLIGFVGRDHHGLEGLELILEKELTGSAGRIRYVRDAGGRPLWISDNDYSPPVNGKGIRTTIDLTIQSLAEQALERSCREFRARSGQLIVLDARAGDILAMANYPFFDPNQRSLSRPAVRRNRSVTDAFEPGSIFKPFVWSSAVEVQVGRPGEMIDCTEAGYYVSPQGRRLRDTRGHGKVSLAEVLVKSSNIGMAIIGQRMGAADLHDAVRAFGFGDVTHCELPGESRGIVHPLRQWNHYSVTSVPMGQEISATPIQLVRAFTVFANHGQMVQPRIRLPNQDIDVAPTLKPVISESTALLCQEVLRRVVTEGTGSRANSDQYLIFGKTGTAQIADRKSGGYLKDQYVASFLCGAPFEQPRIVVGCFIHRPLKSLGYYGGTVAAPAARRVVEQTLAYLGVPPVRSETREDAQLAHHEIRSTE